MLEGRAESVKMLEAGATLDRFLPHARTEHRLRGQASASPARRRPDEQPSQAHELQTAGGARVLARNVW